MNEQKQVKKQQMVTGTYMGELQRRVNAKCDSGYWCVVPGSIGCGFTKEQTSLGIEYPVSHFWAVIEQV